MQCKNHQKCQNTALQEAQAYCTKKGLRFTESRQEVFKLIWQGHKALSAAEIMEKLGNDQPPVTYRALEFLTKNGLVHHVVSLNAYVGCGHVHETNHVGQLLICETCRTVEEVEPDLNALSVAAALHNFIPKQTHVEMVGVCARCR